MTIHFDITKLVDEPRRSGIQRVERALIRHWPDRDALTPCRFDRSTGGMRELPHAILDELCREASPGGIAEERQRLTPLLARPGPVVPPERARLLCAELFDDVARAEHYRAHASTACWLVYDFLPWLRPEWFPAGPANRLMPFLQAMRSVAHRAFISAATKREYAARILRGPCDGPGIGPVLPLGADGLGLARQTFHPARRDVVMLGTIEARKNAASAIRAFQRLWSAGVDARLVMIGPVEQDALEEQALLRTLASEERLVSLGAVPDEAVRAALAQARVLLFPSEGEGYGLPPMEALYSGIPVIVSDTLPALEGLPSLGQIRLRSADPAAIATAVRSVLDDDVARPLWADAARFTLPTWQDFAHATAAWVSACPRDSPRDPGRS